MCESPRIFKLSNDPIFKLSLLPISLFSKHRSALRSIRVIRVANCIFRMWIEWIVALQCVSHPEFSNFQIIQFSNYPFYQSLAFPIVDPRCVASASSALPTVFFERGLNGSLYVQCGSHNEFSNFQIIQFSNYPFYQSLAFPIVDPRCIASASSALPTVFFNRGLNGSLQVQCRSCYEFSNFQIIQ